jgi:diacylglycerol kinase (ATP)
MVAFTAVSSICSSARVTIGRQLAVCPSVMSRLIVNPAAGSDEGVAIAGQATKRLRDRFGDVDVFMTKGEGDARAAAREAAAAGCDYLFVAGGDGTLNEAINGVSEIPHALSAVTFGVVPIGTGNDFATALGIPDDADAAIEVLARRCTRAVDLGRVNGTFFVNVSAGGFIAEASEAVTGPMKTVAGKLAYLIGGAQVLLRHEAIDTTYRTGSTRQAARLEAFAVCNSRLVGGGRLIAPDAQFDDGELDVCLIADMPVMDFVALLRKVSDGEHVSDTRVSYFRTRELEFTFDRKVKVNVDGQVFEEERCTYSVLPKAVTFLGGEC